MTYQEAYSQLEQIGQAHILKFFSELTAQQQEQLLCEIEQTDFSVLSLANKGSSAKKRGKITPIPALTLEEIEAKRSHYEAIGLKALQNGEIGAVLLAGGMGTRLGSDKPKGMYNIGVTKELFIFQRIMENLMDAVRLCGTPIHLFIMTSDKNHEDTTDFFQRKNYFGYNKDYIHFFRQDMAPASDYSGKVLLEQKYRLAASPNGNGGWFSSIIRNGLLDIIKKNNIQWLNVFAVDNVLQRIADPVFLGAVLDGKYSCGSKVIRKSSPEEKVGVMCLEDGHPSIIEYYELTEAMRNEKTEHGTYAYNYGVILNYLFQVEQLEELSKHSLPYHLAEKKIPCLDSAGQPVAPDKPNGYKYELLILDMISMLDTCLPFEIEREKEFAPIKNKTGEDSVESARRLLKKNGVKL